MRLLVVEGNPSPARESLITAGGVPGGRLYAEVLSGLTPDVAIDVIHPADAEPRLSPGTTLADYDGVVVSGSRLHVYDDTPAVGRQIALVRAALEAGVPMLGSCWGAQVATVAAGGRVAKSPRGREIGFARKIALTPAGRGSPLYDGKAAVFDSLAVHYDEITQVPAGAVVLAANGHAAVQALAFTWRGGGFFGVQYHPEFDLRHVARLVVNGTPAMLEQGFFADAAAARAYAATLETLHADPARRDLAWRLGIDDDVLDAGYRRLEIRNWVERVVRPMMAARRRRDVASVRVDAVVR